MGNGLGQLIQFSSILLLSRLYAPSDFGVLGQVQSYATVFAIFCTLQMHLAVPLCKNAEQARSLVSTVVAICSLIVFLALPFALWFGKNYVYALFLAMCVGMSNTFNGYLIYQGSFGNISRFYVLRSIAIVVVQSGIGLAGSPQGLIWGALGGEALTAAYLAMKSQHTAASLARGGLRRVFNVVKDHSAFTLFGTMQEAVSVSAFYAPLFLFAHTFDNAIAGQYAMASRLIWAPVILFAGSLTQVLYHGLGKAQHGERLSLSCLKLPHVVYYPILIAAPVVCFFLRDFVLIVLGSKWQLAVDMLPLILAWGAVFVISTPARAVCRMLKRQKVHLVIDVGMLLGISLTFFFENDSPMKTMIGILGVAAIQNFLMIMTAWTAMKEVPPEGKLA